MTQSIDVHLPPAPRSAFGLVAFGLTACILMSACGTAPDGAGGPLDRALQAVGWQKPALPPVPAPTAADLQRVRDSVSRRVALRVHAGQVLNTSPAGESLSVVARIYRLRDPAAFERATYAAFQDAKSMATFAGLSADISNVREVVLTPGQKYEVMEEAGSDAPFLAVVVLFRAPAGQRWRYVFDTRASASSGVTLGVHGCALSVAAGQALDTSPESTRLAGVRCNEPGG